MLLPKNAKEIWRNDLELLTNPPFISLRGHLIYKIGEIRV